jgi:hypothetical protein
MSTLTEELDHIGDRLLVIEGRYHPRKPDLSKDYTAKGGIEYQVVHGLWRTVCDASSLLQTIDDVGELTPPSRAVSLDLDKATMDDLSAATQSIQAEMSRRIAAGAWDDE